MYIIWESETTDFVMKKRVKMVARVDPSVGVAKRQHSILVAKRTETNINKLVSARLR